MTAPDIGRTLIWDLETDGLLPELTRIHILVIKDYHSQERWVFHQNSNEDNILDGITMLNEAGVLVGHNIVGFDMPALWKCYGDYFNPQGIVRDTLVMVRMLFSDEKERDFRRYKRGDLDGKYLGSHELGAWGQRLGFPKGDYADVKKEELKAEFPHLALKENRKELNRLVWEHWSQAMEDYAVQDVEVTNQLWMKCLSKPWPDFATKLEHTVHAEMERVQENGFPFHVEEARVLEDALRAEHEKLSTQAIEHFGSWWVPGRWLHVNGKKCNSYVVGEAIEDENGEVTFIGEKKKDLPIFQPRLALGEDTSREHWGEVQIPKRTVRFKPGVHPQTGEPIHKGDTEAGCPFCPVELKEFNPNSRAQIIDRLKTIYGWEPQEFTEEGTPSVNDDVLRDLTATVPICDALAEIFYFSKRLGQLHDGKNGLIKKAEERGDNKIHPRIIVGGTVTNRASHSNPNIAQVPRVVFKNLLQWEDEDATYSFAQNKIIYGREVDGHFVEGGLTPLVGPDGKQLTGKPKRDQEGNFVLDDEGRVKVGKSLLKGRAGDHGWDFRNLFYVPEGYKLMGADQKGIELRALGHYMAEFDGGEYLRLVVEADPHDLHQSVMELDSRDTAKTVIYALIYGAQDYKLGVTIDPGLALKPNAAKALGAEMRRRLMTRIPALGQVVQAVQRMARRGYVEALDGRHLYVRAKHSALNTLLQGAGATVAKMWCVNFEHFCEDDGLINGWYGSNEEPGDFAILAWIHDELQVAVRDDAVIMEMCRRNIVDAAISAGERLNFRAPVDVDVKWGTRWSHTH